ncbi:hypothetical protein GMJAKD_10370 [Candidatus Electrothrix aarhusensis]
MDAAQVEYDCCKKMDRNINKVIADRVVFPEKPIEGKGKVCNRSIEFACGFGVRIKCVEKSGRMKIGYVKRGIVQDVAGIIKMPTVRQNVTVDDEAAEEEKRSKKAKLFELI